MPRRWMSIVLVALIFALPGHSRGTRRVVPDVRRAAPPTTRLDASGDPLPPGALWRLGSLRLNAVGTVEFLAFTPDGKNLISAGQGAALQVWDPTTGRRRDLPALAKLPTAEPAVGRMEVRMMQMLMLRGKETVTEPQHYSLSGRLLYAYDGQGTAHLIDTQSMRVLRSWPKTPAEAMSHALTPDGTLLASPSAKPGVVVLIDPLGKGPPRELELGIAEGGIGTMAFSPDGKYFAVLDGAEKAVLLCLVKSGKRLRRYKAENVAFLGFGAGGESLLIGTNEALVVYEIDSLEQKHKSEHAGATPSGFTWVVPGKTLAIRYSDGVVQLWDVATGKSIREVTLEQPTSPAFAVSPDGLRIATANATGQIQLWDARTGNPTLPAEVSRAVLVAGFDATGGGVVVVHPGRVNRHATRTGDFASKLEVELAEGRRVLLSPTSDRLADLTEGLSILDTKTGKKTVVIKEEPNAPVQMFAFLPDGRHALIDQAGKPDIAILDMEANRRWNHFRAGQNGSTMIHVGKDGRTMYRTPNETAVERWEMATGKRRTSLDITGQLLDVSPDGRRLAVGVGTTVQLVEIATGRIALLPNAINPVWALSFSPDNDWFVCAGDPKRGITVWDARTGRLAARVVGHRGAMRGLEFSPNGKEFLTASVDGTLLVWDLAEVLRKGRVEPAVVPAVRPMEALWADLASDDAVVADEAIRDLVRSPGVAERFLARNLNPVGAIPPAVLDGLVAELDGDRATGRDLAESKLAALGEQAIPALRKATKSGSPEVRRRVKRLLAGLEVFARTGLQARWTRALEALEMLGTASATKLLGELAGGADAGPTREARASLARLRARVSSEP